MTLLSLFGGSSSESHNLVRVAQSLGTAPSTSLHAWEGPQPKVTAPMSRGAHEHPQAVLCAAREAMKIMIVNYLVLATRKGIGETRRSWSVEVGIAPPPVCRHADRAATTLPTPNTPYPPIARDQPSLLCRRRKNRMKNDDYSWLTIDGCFQSHVTLRSHAAKQ